MQTTLQPILNPLEVTAALGNVCMLPQSMRFKELNYSVKYFFPYANFVKACYLRSRFSKTDLCTLVPAAPLSCGYYEISRKRLFLGFAISYELK